MVGTSDASDVARVERIAHQRRIESRVQADRTAEQHAAHDDRQAADVEERHARKPSFRNGEPRGSAAASALAAKLLQLRHAPFERPDVPDVNSTTNSVSSAASSPGNGPVASGRSSNRGTATVVSPGSRTASSARRGSPFSPSNQPACASVSCCASSSMVSRAFSGNAALPASESAASHPTNRASPGSSIATGAAAGRTDATMCAAPRRARSRELGEGPGRVPAFDHRRVGRDSGAGEQRETEAHGMTPRPAVAVNAARPSRQSTGSATSRTKSPAVRRPCCADASPHAAAQCRA